jgi:competence protein ComEC
VVLFERTGVDAKKASKMMKLGAWLFIMVFMLVVSFLSQWPDNQVRLIMCDVGQGDAFIITHSFTQVLIDGGPANGMVLACLSRYVPFWDRTLELVVMSHGDSDHAGGLVEVLRRYQVRTFLASHEARDVWEVLEQVGIPAHIVHQDMRFALGEIDFEVWWPPEKGLGLDNLNDDSLVMLMKIEGRSALFTGDISATIERNIMNQKRLERIEVLKIGHHGSKTSTTEPFLDYLKPSIALIGVGKNRYGHPHEVVMERLKRYGIQVFRSDEQGTTVLQGTHNGWRLQSTDR